MSQFSIISPVEECFKPSNNELACGLQKSQPTRFQGAQGIHVQLGYHAQSIIILLSVEFEELFLLVMATSFWKRIMIWKMNYSNAVQVSLAAVNIVLFIVIACILYHLTLGPFPSKCECMTVWRGVLFNMCSFFG